MSELENLFHHVHRDALDYIETNPDDHASRLLAGLLSERDRLIGLEQTARDRAEYLQHEINKMRRVMQAAGTWDQFCADYAAAERSRP